MLSKIFKAYDVRGTYPDELDKTIAKQIGKAFATLTQASAVIIGRDMRVSSPELAKAFMEGLNELGVDAIDIGEVCTDGTYFASGSLKLPAVMFTASHNPKQYNGMKFSKAGAVPVNQDTGLDEMKRTIEQDAYKQVNDKKGSITEKDILSEYVAHVHSFIDTSKLAGLKIAVDAGNGMAGKMIPLVFDGLGVDIEPLFFELDGDFPNHPADPSKWENLRWLQDCVKEKNCDFGMAFDGDADRIFFVNEKGEIINSSLITSLIAKGMLEKNPGSKIVHNLVCSKGVPETVEKYGGRPIVERVGHSFIKATMARTQAIFGGEHSAHYYYRDNYNADSGIISALVVCEMVAKAGKPLSELLEEFHRYATMEETSVEVEDKEAKISELKERYSAADPKPDKISELDGLTVEFKDWWFNVRPSNTEPLLRLNLEADTKELMGKKKGELLTLLRAHTP